MKNNKEIEIEREKYITEDKKEEQKINKKADILKCLLFFAILIYAVIIRNTLKSKVVVLGDFGSIIPLFFNIVYTTGFSWLPIFSILGLISVILKKYLGEMSNVLLIVVCIICLVSTLLLICV